MGYSNQRHDPTPAPPAPAGEASGAAGSTVQDGQTIRGHVKWFDPKKGFGFIVGPDGQDVFVHFSQIAVEGFKTLQDDQPVTYELVEGDKGFQAQSVMPVSEPAD